MKGANLKPARQRPRRRKRVLQEDAWGVALIVLVVVVNACMAMAAFAAVQVHKNSLEELYARVGALEDALIRERLDRLSGQASDLGCE